MDMVDMDGYWWVCLDSDGCGGYVGYGWIRWIWADIGGYGYPDIGGYSGYGWIWWISVDIGDMGGN